MGGDSRHDTSLIIISPTNFAAAKKTEEAGHGPFLEEKTEPLHR